MSDFNKDFGEYKKDLDKASKDENINRALGRAVKSYRENTDAALAKYPHTLALAEEVRGIKDYSMENNKQLLDQAMKVIESNHGKAFLCGRPGSGYTHCQ